MPPKLAQASKRCSAKLIREKSHRIKKVGKKRPRITNKVDNDQSSRRHRGVNNEFASSPSPSSSEHSFEDYMNSEDAKSTYDKLLMTLGPSCDTMANLYARRHGDQKIMNDKKGDGGSDSELASLLEGEEDVGGVYKLEDYYSNGEDRMNDALQLDGEAQTKSEVIAEASDNSDEDDLENGVQACKKLSSFSIHLGHALSKADVDELVKKNWKFEWEVPAFETTKSKWVGTRDCFMKEGDEDASYGLKLRLYKHCLDLYRNSAKVDFQSSKQRLFFSLFNSYRDTMHCNKRPFYLKGQQEDTNVLEGYIMHALNHIFRTKDLVAKNDAKLSKHKETCNGDTINDDRFLDHGFSRPKVLILLPLASIALRVVNKLIQLTPTSHKVNVEYFDRFTSEFGDESSEVDDDTSKSPNHVQDDGSSKSQKPSKPADFEALFGGNNNDHFMIGIKFTKKSIKLYADFYSSDMIVASPLGIITKIGNAEFDKEKDVDFLSSIEILIIDHADVIAMQNWSHLNSVVEQLNRMPSKQHGTDIMRIRQLYLDGHAKFYRQTILLSSFLNPEINALFNHLCLNYSGKVKLVSNFKGVLSKVLLEVRQVYERFHVTSPIEADDARFDHFIKKVFPKIKDSIQGGTMLFISSYLDFVRIRNFLKSQNASFCLLGEYTKQSDISRARVWFYNGMRKIMLYTERAHFYHRYKIRGMQNLIFYSLPERKEFYPELVNMLDGSDSMTCTVLFSRFDNFRLERIVGTESAAHMLKSKKDVFLFC